MRALLSLLLLFAMASPPRAATGDADMTVVSLLTMMKGVAGANVSLRLQVAGYMQRTRQENVFGSYAEDALTESGWHRLADPRNRELIDQAKAAFRRGDLEAAKELMRQCKWLQRRGPCSVGEIAGRFKWPYEIIFQWQFITWDLEAGRFASARRRLETTEWSDRFRAMFIVQVAGAHIAAGLRDEGHAILRMLQPSDPTFESCIVNIGPLRSAAALRKMACEGQVREALDLALELVSPRSYIDALGVIAEGVAGIPGYSNEVLFQ